MDDKNYFVIHGWMINELNLKGNELLIYAIIYGFSQTENQVFTGSRQYLADFTNTTKVTVQNSLNSLVEKELIIKEETTINSVKYCSYRVNDSSKKTLPPVKKLYHPGKKTLLNNIDNNIDTNIDKSMLAPTEKRKTKYQKLHEVTITKVMDEDVIKSLDDYLSFRIKYGLSESTWSEILDNLISIAEDKHEAIEIIKMSKLNSWKSFFPLKKSYSNSYKDNIQNTEKTDEQLLREKYLDEFKMVRPQDRPKYEDWRKDNV